MVTLVTAKCIIIEGEQEIEQEIARLNGELIMWKNIRAQIESPEYRRVRRNGKVFLYPRKKWARQKKSKS